MATHTDAFRPTFHLTDPDQFINDPNGPVWFDGEYHVFYQRGWPKSWGHAVSRDLVHWQVLPPALEPDELGDIWSGSCVVDWRNTSGFFPDGPGLVATFTHHADKSQSQSLAYSRDRGRTWIKYAGNPVLLSPGIPDFRDPKVFWHEPTGRWAMVLATGDHVSFYASGDLKRWEETGTFGVGHGSHEGVWECPDLFELPVEGSPGEARWVLLISSVAQSIFAPGSTGIGATGVQYFIGRFDGRTFVNENPPQMVLPAVHGPDEYATTTFSDVPGGCRLAIGWLSNWQYANKLPTSPWRNLLSVPRALRLVATRDGVRLMQTPVKELMALRRKLMAQRVEHRVVSGETSLLARMDDACADLEVELAPRGASRFGLRLRVGQGHHTDLAYDVSGGVLELDRSRSGMTSFSPAFVELARVPLALRDGVLRLRVLMDRCSLEICANDGAVYLPALVFPPAEADGIAVFAEGGAVEVRGLSLWAAPRDSVVNLR